MVVLPNGVIVSALFGAINATEVMIMANISQSEATLKALEFLT